MCANTLLLECLTVMGSRTSMGQLVPPPDLMYVLATLLATQFLTFELVRDKIFAEVPAAQESVFYALVVSNT